MMKNWFSKTPRENESEEEHKNYEN